MRFEQSEFIENLKYYRKLKGYTQEKLAEVCGCETGTIGCIEIGRQAPSFKMICLIAEALEIHPSDLFLRNSSFIGLELKSEIQEKISNDIKTILDKYL